MAADIARITSQTMYLFFESSHLVNFVIKVNHFKFVVGVSEFYLYGNGRLYQ